MSRHTIAQLRHASRIGSAYPLMCSCGGDVELAGPGHKGAVRCLACGAIHQSLAMLVVKEMR